MSKEIYMPNMVTLTPSEIPRYVKIARENHKVLILMGKPGTGKSQSVYCTAKEIAKEKGLIYNDSPTLEDWNNPKMFCVATQLVSSMEAVDVRGLPYVIEDSKGNKVTMFSRIETTPINGQGIVFYDEFSTGRTDVQNANQYMLLEHKFCNTKISDNIQFVLASNRPQDGGQFAMSMAMKNRLWFFEVLAGKTEEWLGIMNKINKPINSNVAAFLLSPQGEKYADNYDPDKDIYAYGTRRSWTGVSETLDNTKNLTPDEIKKITGAACGADAGIDFKSFMEDASKINMQEILDNPKMVGKYENKPGMLYSIALNLIARFDEEQDREAIFNVILALTGDEYGLFWLDGARKRIGSDKMSQAMKSPKGKEILKRYGNLMWG